MSTIANLFNTLKYSVCRKSEPIFNDYAKIITDFSELSPKIPDPFDLNGMQYYKSGPSSNGIFNATRMTEAEQQQVWDEFVALYTSWGVDPIPIPKYRWSWWSMACHSQNKFRMDIYKPGRMVVKSTIPKYGWSAPWIYMSMNKGDFNNPSLMPIDKPSEPTEYYFEIDMYENFVNCPDQRIAFSGHYGTQSDRKMKTISICGSFDNSHYSEIKWDGKGNWIWLLNNIIVHKAFIPQPTEKIYPFFMLTLGLNEEVPDTTNSLTWKVDWVKISDNIITTGLSQ